MDELKDELKIDNSPGEESSFDIVEDTVETLNVLKENDPQRYAEEVAAQLSSAIGLLTVPDKRQQMIGIRLVDVLTPHITKIAGDGELAPVFTKELSAQLEQRAEFLKE